MSNANIESNPWILSPKTNVRRHMELDEQKYIVNTGKADPKPETAVDRTLVLNLEEVEKNLQLLMHITKENDNKSSCDSIINGNMPQKS